MSPEQIQNLKIELATLEAEWKAHGESSIDFRKDVKETMAIIQSDIRALSDTMHNYTIQGSDRREHCFDMAKVYTDKVVRLAIGIPALILVLLKLVDTFHK